MPHAAGADFRFSWIKASYQNLLQRHPIEDKDIPDFCASVQVSMTRLESCESHRKWNGPPCLPRSLVLDLRATMDLLHR